MTKRYHHLALHVCCAPCTLASYDELTAERAVTTDATPVVFDRITAIYYNPNIAPMEEYVHRRDTFATYADKRGIAWVELPYDSTSWMDATAVTSTSIERCRACYVLRLAAVAAWAREAGCDALTTTLTISPWQNHKAIAATGAELTDSADSSANNASKKLTYLPFDFRDLYRDSQQSARDLGLYRQNYCGCLPGKREAERERIQRKKERA